MNKSERYVYEAIKNWVWSGFYNEADIQEMMDDILDGDCDEKMLLSLVSKEFELKKSEEANWPGETDYDRLAKAFDKLHEEGVCALHNAGYTMSGGLEAVTEAVAQASARRYRSYCFYHSQDMERAIKGNGLYLAFGSLDGDETLSVEVGKAIVSALQANELEVEWNGGTKDRIFLPKITWQKRSKA